MKIKSFLLAAVAAAGLTVSAESWIYSTPACETRNGAGYAVKVDGADAPVSEVRNSAMPVNIRWPGHQRELDQTEIDGMVRFAFSGKVTVAVTAPRDFKEVRVRPLARQIRPQVEGRVITFELTRPGAYSVEFDGIHRNLHVFADPPAEYRVNKSADTIVFGPGEHDAGVIELKSGQSLFLDEGAVVFGRVYARDADHIRIFGRGILDMSRIKEQPKPIDPKLAEEQKRKHFAITNAKRWDAIRLEFCDDVAIDGITIRDSLCYNIRPIGCRNLDIGNVKIVGNWRYNSDGIDMHNCENVRVHDCFVRTFDDSICVKGFDYAMNEDDMLHDGYRHDVFTNAVIERCTVWCDWGRSLEFGAETRAREIADITWRDCDLLRSCHFACELQNCDYADIHGVLFEDIRVDLEDRPQRSVYSASAKDFDPAAVGGQPCVFGSRIHVVAEYSKDGTRRGRNRDITLRNIRVTGKSFPIFRISGYDEDHRTTGVVVDGFYWNGREISPELDTPELCGPFAERPRFVRSGGSDAARNCSESMNGVPAESSSGEKGGVKVLVLGNSIALHEPRPQIGWTNEWGMAASAADRDFAHLVAAGIGQETGRKVDLHVKNIWLFEKDYWHYPFERELGELVRFAPDYVVIAVGENMADFASDDDRAIFRRRFGELLDAFGTGEKRPKTVVRGVFWTNAQKDAEMKAVSDERQVPFVALDICNQPGMKATGFFKHPGVAAHPSDQGMAEIARRLLKALFP